MANVAGGKGQGVRYLDDIDATLSVNLNTLAGLRNTKAFFYGLGNQGGSISSLAGDVQGLDNIEAENSWRLYEAWIEHIFPRLKTSVLAGKYDLNSEFDVNPTAQLFINSSQGIGAAYGNSGVMGPSIFPYTSLAVRVKTQVENGLYFKAAVFDGVPSDPGNSRGTKIFFHKKDGALIATELSYTPGPKQAKNGFKYQFLGRGVEPVNGYRLTLGGWLYTQPRMGWVKSHQRGRGLYASVDAKLYHKPQTAEQGLAGYVRLGIANGKINRFTGYTGAGLVYTGLFKGHNQLGVATAISWSSSDYKTIARRQNLLPAQNESDIEGTYLFAISPEFQLQFDAQYIIHPNTLHSISNSFVVGGRMILSI